MNYRLPTIMPIVHYLIEYFPRLARKYSFKALLNDVLIFSCHKTKVKGYS